MTEYYYFGDVLWASHCPVAVTRLLRSPREIQKILVPIENLTERAMQPLRFANVLAAANQAQITLLHVCDHRATPSKIAWTRSQLSLLVTKLALPNQVEIQVTPHERVVKAILFAASAHDLVVLHSLRFTAEKSLRPSNRTGTSSLGDLSTQLIEQLTGSIVLLGEPQRLNTVVFPDEHSSGKTKILGNSTPKSLGIT